MSKIINYLKNHQNISIILLIIIISGFYLLLTPSTGILPNIQNDSSEDNLIQPNNSRQLLAKNSAGLQINPITPQSASYQTKSQPSFTQNKLIKHGSLSLIVNSINKSQEQIKSITQKFNGFIQSSNFSENEQTEYITRNNVKTATKKRRGYIQIKIPNKNFDSAFEAYKKIALSIKNESISIDNVTEEYHDLETQIKNKKAEEEQYREILKKATKIKDILEVTKYLKQAQTQRERLEGRLQYLNNQIEYSTININLLAEKDIALLDVTWSPIRKLQEGLQNMLRDGRNFIDTIILWIFKLPIIILWGILIYLGIKIGSWTIKKLKK